LPCISIKFFNQNLEDFIARLETATLSKTLRTLDLLERFGNQLGMPHGKKIDDGLFELRVRGKREVRILYAFHKGKVIILLHAFIKKSQKIPRQHIALARRRLNSLDDI
jgi:phage-related protein